MGNHSLPKGAFPPEQLPALDFSQGSQSDTLKERPNSILLKQITALPYLLDKPEILQSVLLEAGAVPSRAP